MSRKDKTPAAPETTEEALRNKRFMEIERAQGDKPGAKEMKLTRNPRTAEKPEQRTREFLEIERGRKS